MLELFGSGYVIEHCVSAISKKQQDKLYKVYVTNCLQAITENTSHFWGMNGVVDYGSRMKTSWIDLLEKNTAKKTENEIDKIDNKTVDDVVDGIWSNIQKGGE